MSKFLCNQHSILGVSAIIVDYMYYTVHITEIDDWLHEHDSEREGMVITFANEKVQTMFLLRWS